MNTFRTFVVAVISLSALCAQSAFSADERIQTSQLEALDALVNERADEFAGLTIDEERKKITVRFVLGADPVRVREHVRQVPRGARRAVDETWSVELRQATRSQRHLHSVFERINKLEPWASAVQPVLSGWEVDIERNVVAVYVTAVTPALLAEANRTFGRAVELRLATDENTRFVSRTNDWPFWLGGLPVRGLIPDAVFASDEADCTTAFSVSDPGGAITGQLTAGHCFGYGVPLRQVSDNEVVGAILERELRHNGLDYGFLGFGEGYYPGIWTSLNGWREINNPNSPDGVVAFPVAVGSVVCFNGAKTGERCNAKITSMSACKTIDFITTCQLITVKSTDGRKMGGSGDSGGPVYRKASNGKVLPEGIIVGGNSAGTSAWYHSTKVVLAALSNSSRVGGFGPWFIMVP